MTKDDEAEVVLTEASRGLVRLLVVCSRDGAMEKYSKSWKHGQEVRILEEGKVCQFSIRCPCQEEAGILPYQNTGE